jgi:hypothetical protein
MINQRTHHTASVLLNGKVLVTGGYSNGGNTNSAELYDPSTGMWTTTGSMNFSRSAHTGEPGISAQEFFVPNFRPGPKFR